VLTGRISVNQFVALTSTTPAKLYGLYPQKGTIAIGSDADIVIWEERPNIIDNAALHHAVDYTPYQGMALKAWPATTISKGKIIWDRNEFLGTAGHGSFIARQTMPQHSAPLSGG